MSVYYPRDTFDKKNRFKSPPKIKNYSLPFEKVWSNSLNKSLSYFIEKVKKNENFSLNEFKNSIDAIIPIIK